MCTSPTKKNKVLNSVCSDRNSGSGPLPLPLWRSNLASAIRNLLCRRQFATNLLFVTLDKKRAICNQPCPQTYDWPVFATMQAKMDNKKEGKANTKLEVCLQFIILITWWIFTTPLEEWACRHPQRTQHYREVTEDWGPIWLDFSGPTKCFAWGAKEP
jgi:hypothetical protein